MKTSRLIVMALVPVLASPAHAGVIVNSQGFESPLFTTTFAGTGQLEGQTPMTFNGTWLQPIPGGSGTAIVQTAVVASGTQAVRVVRGANSYSRWAVPVAGYPTGTLINIQWDMRVEQASGPAGSSGPFFGMESYDQSGTATGVLGTLGVNATSGAVLTQNPFGFLIPTGVSVALGTWHHYTVELNYATHTYRVFLDGAFLGANGFVDQSVPGGLNQFSHADIFASAASGDAASQQLTGTAYFDNFLVRDVKIGDVNDDGVVNVSDLLAVIESWGTCPTPSCAADINLNGIVNVEDLLAVISGWSP